MQKMGEFRIADWALAVDLLGTAATMAEDSIWLRATEDLLTLIESAVHETVNMTKPSASVVTYQYGDTVNFFSDDPGELALLSVILQKKLFLQDHLAQMGLAYGGVYDLTGSDFLTDLSRKHGKIKLQCLVGKAVSKGHFLMKKVKGPRIFIDEEAHVPPNPKAWERFAHKDAPLSDIGFPRSEIAWWRQIIDIDETVEKRISQLKQEISERNNLNSNGDPREARRIKSLEDRLAHLAGFQQVLKSDN